MAVVRDITGLRFGRLVALERIVRRRNGVGTISIWKCQCDCGNQSYPALSSLRQGDAKSCGCLKADITTARSIKHGHSHVGKTSKTYNSWRAMVERCNNPGNKVYWRYGGSGVQVCDRWLDFRHFLEDMGERPEGKTLDRINNLVGYEPSNCRWATWIEQAANRRKKGSVIATRVAA